MYHDYTEQEERIISDWLTSSFQRLIERDQELLNPANIESEHALVGERNINREVHETAINHRLAVYLEMLVPEEFHYYHIDNEYNRYINNYKLVLSSQTNERIQVRPDILVHTRTNLSLEIPHLLVIEAKKYKNNEKDRNHIMDIMADPNYRYKYGLLVSYYDNLEEIQCELITYLNDEFIVKPLRISRQSNTQRVRTKQN